MLETRSARHFVRVHITPRVKREKAAMAVAAFVNTTARKGDGLSRSDQGDSRFPTTPRSKNAHAEKDVDVSILGNHGSDRGSVVFSIGSPIEETTR